MRFLVDANLSPRVALLLRAAGHDAVHVDALGLLAADDATILSVASAAGRTIISADADFGALLALGGLSKPSFLLLRSADSLRPEEQAALIIANLRAIDEDLELGAIVTIARGRLRVRSLPVHDQADGGSS